jgi:lipopolysaccharide export system protein LptA
MIWPGWKLWRGMGYASLLLALSTASLVFTCGQPARAQDAAAQVNEAEQAAPVAAAGAEAPSATPTASTQIGPQSPPPTPAGKPGEQAAAGNAAEASAPTTAGNSASPSEPPQGSAAPPPATGGTVVQPEEETAPGVGAGAAPQVAQPMEPGQLPPFVEQQPGFIPDKSPEDLFAQEQAPAAAQPLAVGDFSTLLGASRLPAEQVEQLLQQYEQDPSMNLDNNYARIVVPNGDISGSTESKQFHIEGGLIVFYNNVKITGDTADIDEKNELAIITSNVNIIDPKYTLKTDELRIFFNEKRFQANGFVQFNKLEDAAKRDPNMSLGNKDRLREYLAGKQFELYCSELFYNWDTKELIALDSVRLVHPSFNGTMERIDYNDETKAYEMGGSVIITVDKYDWIFDTKVVADNDEKKVKAITDQPTKIECDRLVYSEDTGVAQFYADATKDVTFDQTIRSLNASYIEVNDETKDFYAEGSSSKKVRYAQQNGQWLFTAELLKKDEISPDLDKAVEGPMTAEMQSMAYNYERKRIEMLGGVNIVSGPRTLTAQDLIQDETAKYFLLRGNVHIKPDEQSEVMAAQVYLDTANDVLTFVGLVEGEMFSSDLSSQDAEQPGGSQSFQAAPGLFNQQAGQLPGTAGNQGTGTTPGGAAGRQGSNTSNTAEGR